jgi:tetratricopeptide (TPR) repeat protein
MHNYYFYIPRVILFLIGFTSIAAEAGQLDKWKRYTSDNMVLYTDHKEEKARQFINEFEVFRSVVVNLQKGDNTKKLPIVRTYLFSSESLFKDFVDSRAIGGYFVQRSSGPIMIVGPDDAKENIRQTLFHEYVHFLLHSVIPINYAPWYNEGIAEFFSTMIIRDDFVYVGRAPERAAYSLSKIGFLKMDDLFAEKKVWSRGNRFAAKFYGSAWLATHFVTLGARNGFPSYYRNTAKFLKLQSQGVNAEQAFDLSFDIPMSDFTKQVKKYSRINNREGVSFPRPAINTDYQIDTITESRMAIEVAKVKGISADNQFSYDLYQKALQANEPFAIAYRALRSAESNEVDEALGDLNTLLKMTDDGVDFDNDTLWYIGMAYTQLADTAASEDALAPMADRESEFRERAFAANSRSNEIGMFVPTLVNAAYHYQKIGDKEKAMTMLKAFTEYSPANYWALMQAAIIAIELEEFEIAKKHLQSILHNVHEGEWVEDAQELLELIDEKKKANK